MGCPCPCRKSGPFPQREAINSSLVLAATFIEGGVGFAKEGGSNMQTSPKADPHLGSAPDQAQVLQLVSTKILLLMGLDRAGSWVEGFSFSVRSRSGLGL